jgi:hypothetical protein
MIYYSIGFVVLLFFFTVIFSLIRGVQYESDFKYFVICVLLPLYSVSLYYNEYDLPIKSFIIIYTLIPIISAVVNDSLLPSLLIVTSTYVICSSITDDIMYRSVILVWIGNRMMDAVIKRIVDLESPMYLIAVVWNILHGGTDVLTANKIFIIALLPYLTLQPLSTVQLTKDPPSQQKLVPDLISSENLIQFD